MPVPVSPQTPVAIFPPLTRAQVDAARTSAWHELFEDVTAPATIIDLDAIGEREAFLHWLDADSIFIPEDAEGTSIAPASTTGSGSSSAEATATDSDAPVYRLPKLNAAIRAAISQHGGAVFPKLNWTAPRDAAFLLPQGHGPLHCTTPADVYLLLKSSDFVAHGLGPRAYEGTTDGDAGNSSTSQPPPRLELVLKKYQTDLNPAREVRCFVRGNTLLAIAQRDPTYYDHLQSPAARQAVVDAVRSFWEDEVRGHYEGGDDYVFDLYLGDNTEPTLIDFGPYRQSTDPLLFSYDELRALLAAARAQQDATNSAGDAAQTTPAADAEGAAASTGASASGRGYAGDSGAGTSTGRSGPGRLPVLRVVDSAGHPAASRPAPTFSTNMMPLEMLQMSEGRTLAEFAQAWEQAMAADGEASDSDTDDDDDDDKEEEAQA